jgi:hypothetical protein
VGHRLVHLRHPAVQPRARAAPGVARPPRTSGIVRALPLWHAPKPEPPTASGPLRDRGLGLLAVFTASTFLIVGLVCLVGSIDRWWILIPVMAIDLAVTAAVLAVMIRLLDDGAGR